jgi:hypothetical protein
MTEAQLESSYQRLGVETARDLMSALVTVLRVVATAVLGTICMTLGLASIASASPIRSRAAVAPVPGYWLMGEDGGVFSFNARFLGTTASQCDASVAFSCATAIASTPDGGGYTLVTPIPNGTGQLTEQFGDATGNESCTTGSVHFSAAAAPESTPVTLADPWTAIASTPSGHGFWMLNQGGNLAYCGDAGYFGDMGFVPGFVPFVSSIAVGIAATPDGKGYWVATSDGGVFAFGNAGFYGSMGGKRLNAPIRGIAATPDGKGYWLVALDGGVFAFGDAHFYGSMGGHPLNAPMGEIAANPNGLGYWTVAEDGGVFSFGGAPFEGSMGGHALIAPILGFASRAG